MKEKEEHATAIPRVAANIRYPTDKSAHIVWGVKLLAIFGNRIVLRKYWLSSDSERSKRTLTLIILQTRSYYDQLPWTSKDGTLRARSLMRALLLGEIAVVKDSNGGICPGVSRSTS